MTLTTHILTGTIIGTEIGNPYAVVAASLATHFILDSLPHGDYISGKSTMKEAWKVVSDLVIGILIMAAILAAKGGGDIPVNNLILALVASLFPDFITFLYCHLKMKFLRPVKLFHEGLHCFENGSHKRRFSLNNSWFEIAVLAFSFLFLLLR